MFPDRKYKIGTYAGRVKYIVSTRAERADSVRPHVRALVESTSYRDAAKVTGVSKGALQNLLDGSTPQEATLSVLERWVQAEGLYSNGGDGASGYVFLPRYEVQAAAGTGVPVLSEHVADWVSFKVDWLRRTLGISPTNLALIEAVGDSMNPTIRDGDLLLLDVSEPKLRGDGLYVIGVDDALLVKRVSIEIGGEGLTITSDNPQYAHTRKELTRDAMNHVRIIGRVVWAGGRV